MATPSIVCLGVVGKNNNPLYTVIFPSHTPSPPNSSTPPISKLIRTPLQFSLLLSSALDVFESRARTAATSGNAILSGDLGLLQALDERVAVYGFETNTRVKFIAVVDMRGRAPVAGVVRPEDGAAGGTGGGKAVKDADLRVVFRAMQNAYIRLLQNPFYEPDEHSPTTGTGGKKIESKRFAAEMRRIGESWVPGSANL